MLNRNGKKKYKIKSENLAVPEVCTSEAKEENGAIAQEDKKRENESKSGSEYDNNYDSKCDGEYDSKIKYQDEIQYDMVAVPEIHISKMKKRI